MENTLEIWDEAKLKLQFSGRLLVNTSDKHYKFWSAEVNEEGNGYTAYYGRIGSAIRKSIIGTWGPEREINKKVKEKIKKGYREI